MYYHHLLINQSLIIFESLLPLLPKCFFFKKSAQRSVGYHITVIQITLNITFFCTSKQDYNVNFVIVAIIPTQMSVEGASQPISSPLSGTSSRLESIL
jgi:hypothetical protein